ncbi:hypothetical protein FRB98_009229 [Tulasnella sp. 332]|nr:hypothetical protein FRB98_009229 [Tulasnella sp. 332]
MSTIVKTKLRAAREAIGKKDYRVAEESAQQVLSFEPDNYNANVFLGVASLELGKMEESEQAYRKATTLNPDQFLAWQGLSKFYEKIESWVNLAATLERLMDIYTKSDDASKCAETLQRYLELSDALGLLLQNSRYYALLSTLPAPEPTAPTSTPTYVVQSAIHNSFPILEELLNIEEGKFRDFITKEVAKRRTRLGAPPIAVLTAELRHLYGEILNHPYTSDDLRRTIESKLLRHLYDYLIGMPNSPDTKAAKVKQRKEVESMSNGVVLLSIPDLLAWTIHIESRDVELLEQYDPSMLLRFVTLFPAADLTPVARSYLIHNGLPIKEDEEIDIKYSKDDVAAEEEDPFALALDSFPNNKTSIFAHRFMCQLYLENEEYDLARRVAEAGLSLVDRLEGSYGCPLSSTRKGLNICVATALVGLFPPKHHLRAASLLDDVLDSDSDNIPCLMGRAAVYQFSRSWKKAEQLFARVETLKGPEDMDEGLEAREQKLWCTIQDGRVDDGIAELQVVIEQLDSLRGKETQKARAWWRLGQSVWGKGGDHRADAYPHFITALRRQTTYAPAYTSLGIYYMDYISPPDVVRGSKCFQKAFELDPREGEAARRLASNFADEKEWDLVAVVASRVIAGEGGISGGMDESEAMSKKQCLPTNSWAWKAMGVVELTHRKYPQAIQAFQVVLRADDADFEAWLRLGEAYASAGRHVASLKALERAHEISPGDWGCLCIKGDVLRQVHQHEKALEAFHGVLVMRPGETGVLIALTNTYLDLGREQRATGFISRAEGSFSTAIDTAVGVITDAPGFRAIAWKAIGDALLELAQRPSLSESDTLLAIFDRVTQAVSTFTSNEASSSDIIVAENPSVGTALALALKVYRARLSIIEGESDLVGGASFDVAAVLQRVALSLEGDAQRTTIEEAINLVKRAIRSAPGDASSWNALGTLRFLQEPKLAQHAFIMALEVDNKNAATWSNLGLLYLHHQDLELANHAFYRAQTLDPDYAIAWIGQALIATAHGHLKDARALLEHTVGLPAGVPAADLEFADRIFGLFLSQESGTMSTESLFLPFSVLSRYNQRRPDDSTALHLLALICERLGQEEKAAELLRESINILDVAYNQSEDAEIERRYAIAHANLGRTLLALSDYTGASDAFEVALNLLPEDSQEHVACTLRGHAQWGIGLSAYKLGDLTKALATLEAAMESVPPKLVDIRGHISLTLAQTLWGLGDDEAREMGKNQLFSAITEDPKNMDAITTLAAYGILTLDDDLVDAAFSETLEMPLNERHALDPGRTVERLLVQHHLSKGRVKEALCILESAMHAEPQSAPARQALATMLIQQGDNDRAGSVLTGLLETQELQSRASLASSLSLHSVAISRSTLRDGAGSASKESQRAVFLEPSSDLRLLSVIPPPVSKPASTSSTPLPPTLPPPSRKRVELNPSPRKATPSTSSIDATSKRSKGIMPAPPLPPARKDDAVSKPVVPTPSNEINTTQKPSLIQTAIEDMRKAEQHGILKPPPEDAGRIKRLIHHGKELFKFYWHGLRLIGVHRRTVKDIERRLAAEKAAGREPTMTRWEWQFIRTYKQDVVKLVPFIMILLILEEILPLVVLYVPGLLPSTCILPSQSDRIQQKAETTRVEALVPIKEWLRQSGKDGQALAIEGLSALDGPLSKHLCRAFNLASWGPLVLTRYRLRQHLEYLKQDDALLASEGNGRLLSTSETIKALGERAFRKQSGKLAGSLTPIWANPSYQELVFGPHANDLDSVGGLLEALPGTGFHGLDQARKLASWVELSGNDAKSVYLLGLEPSWLGGTFPTVQLELTKTSVDQYWIITSTPKSTLPQYQPPPPKSLVPPPISSIRRGASQNFRLGKLPAPPQFDEFGQETSSLDIPGGAGKPEVGGKRESTLFTAGKSMVKLMEAYPWEQSPLGPMNKWPQSLKTACEAVMNSPYSWTLWWGPESVLIYNDAYVQIAGNKHPQIFGQSGKLAWGELWETLGPLYDSIMESGNSMACNDGELDWAWIPIHGEDGSVAGLMNTTTETTQKKLYERRYHILRMLGDKTALARSKAEFAELTRKVLTEEAVFDMPFVAFYYNTVEGTPIPTDKKREKLKPGAAAPPKPSRSKGGLEPAEISKSSTLRVTSKLIYKIGVPDNHPAIPTKEVHMLDTVTLKLPQAPAAARRQTTSPGSTVLGQTMSEDSLTVMSPSDNEDAESEFLPSVEPQWPFFDVFSARQSLHVQNLPASIASDSQFGCRLGGYNDPLREAVIIPLGTEGEEVPAAIIIIGLNTRRPYDQEQRTWIDLINLSLSSTLTAALGREAEVRKAEQLAQLDTAKTNFFSSASHELRTPLTLIAGPVNDAAEITTEPRVKELLKLSIRNIARLGRLVDSLMDFSRLEAGRLVGRFQPTELADFTVDLASLFRKPIERESLEYTVTSDLTNESVVYVDQELWEKIVFNVIGNAFKYTMRGHVKVHVQYRPPHAEFIVSDTGVGIPANDLDKVFERFHRVSTTARSHEGTGIGLALTRELVRIHGGHMRVESIVEDKANPDVQHGTTFTVFIPLGSDHLPRQHIDESDTNYPRANTYGIGIVEEATGWARSRFNSDDITPRSESTNSDSAADSNSSRSGDMAALFRFAPEDLILVVDDNNDVRKFLRSIFKRFCSVIEASSAMEGLRVMQTQRPNLVISDFMMPGMDGMQFVSAIRDQPDLELIPVIILTARAGDEARVEGLLSGADDYISKPFKSRELVARAHLHMQIGKRKIQMQRAFDARTQELQILSDLSPVGIFRTDNQGNVTYTNRRWHELTEYPANRGFSDWILNVHPDFQEAVVAVTTGALQSDDGGSLEIRWINGRWTKLQVERISNRRLYEAAQLAQAKERESVAQTRAADADRQRAAADERRRRQELLVDVTSHELRQPVSAILNCSQLVRANLESLTEKLRSSRTCPFVPSAELLATMEEDLDALDSIYQCGLSQERIANDVLSLSRMQLDTLSIQSIEFPLIKELRRILSIFTNELKMKKIALDLRLGESVPLLEGDKVVSDRNRFGQIVTNLMSNAIKFADISSPPNRQIIVFLDLSLDPPLPGHCAAPPRKASDVPFSNNPNVDREVFVYVAVKDSGPGLKPGDLALLFQRFQQGSNSHEVFGGSGLGLFVSRKLCELMGGNIEVSSVYGQGATFRFFIKVHTISNKDRNEHLEISQSSSSSLSPASPTTGTNSGKVDAVILTPTTDFDNKSQPHRTSGPPSQTSYHILITEDNLINQTVLNRQLKQAGFTTQLASNGKQALEAVKKLASGECPVDPTLPRKFDVILMDCEMPVMDGHTATREIRRLEREGALRTRNQILALTGNARQGQIEASLSAGMDDVIIKPYKIDELVVKIRDCIRSEE